MANYRATRVLLTVQGLLVFLQQNVELLQHSDLTCRITFLLFDRVHR